MEAREHIFQYDQNFGLESGEFLPGFRLKYTTLGKMNALRSNVVWVCHALTGSSQFMDWWRGLFSSDGPFDPREYFIICANVLGGCYGSTGPLSINPVSGVPFFHSFPLLTNLDVTRAFDILRQHLEIKEVHTLIGGSLGGQQVLQWAVDQPRVFKHIIPIACNAKHSPWGIAINEAQRLAIEGDATWKQGDESAGANGLKAARALSMISFRTYEAFLSQIDLTEKIDNYKASSYQRYQGEKLVKRFNAYSYWTLTKMMDSHDVGRNNRSVALALKKIRAKTLVIGVDSDVLFPLHEQKSIIEHLPGASLEILSSVYGHDAFLIETKKLNQVISRFLKKESKYVLQ